MKKIIFIWLLSFFLFVFDTLAQKEFQQSIGGEKKEVFNQVIANYKNGYIAVGTTDGLGAGKKDILLVETDSIGKVKWSKTIGGKDIDLGMAICKTNDSNYFITGHSASFGNQYTDLILIKLNANGAIIWGKNYHLNQSEFANTIIPLADGGCLILGETTKYIGKGKDSDILLLKIDPNGKLVWSKKYGGKDIDYGYSIEATKDGGYIIGGETKSFTAGEQDMYVVKINSNGSMEWAKGYGSNEIDFGRSAVPLLDGNYLVAGSIQSKKSRDMDICLTKLSKNGAVLWSRIFGGNNQDYLSALKVLKNGDLVACGNTNSFDLSNENAFIQIFNSSGMPKWGKAYGSDSSDVANSFSIIHDKEIIMCGSTKSFGVKSEDAYLIKTFTNRTLEDCNTTDMTTLVTKKINIKETTGGEETEANMRSSSINPLIKDVTLEEKVLCLPEEDF
jgi:hypothetical protein